MDTLNDFEEYDAATGVPVRHLRYGDAPAGTRDRGWLREGRHLDFNLDRRSQGFVYSGGEDRNLVPLDTAPALDASAAYKQFMREMFESFKPLLENQRYRHYATFDKPRGVVSLVGEDIEEKKLFLRSLVTMMGQYLGELVAAKGVEDGWVVNYGNALNVVNLLNCVYFGQDDETIVLLQRWVQAADGEPDETTLRAAAEEGEYPCGSHAFWSVYVRKMLLRGSFGGLVEDLRASQYERLERDDPQLYEVVKNFIALVEGYDPVTFSHDLGAFLEWKEVAVALRDSIPEMEGVQNEGILQDVYETLGLVSGLNVESGCESWYECLVGLYLFQLPSRGKLGEYLERSMGVDAQADLIQGSQTWEGVCMDVLRGRFLTVVSGLEAFDKFLATFVAVVLEASGMLQVYEEGQSAVSGSIDSMLSDLALTLVEGDKQFFEQGVALLVACNTPETRGVLGEILPRYQVETREDFEWVVALCMEQGLQDAMTTIYRVQGETLFEKGYVYEALHCLAEGGARGRLVGVVWKMFEGLLVGKQIEETLMARIRGGDIREPMLRHVLSPLVCLTQLCGDTPHSTQTETPHTLSTLSTLSTQTWIKRWLALMNFQYLPVHYKPALLAMAAPRLADAPADAQLGAIRALDAFAQELPTHAERCALAYELVAGEGARVENLLRDTRKTLAMGMAQQFLQV